MALFAKYDMGLFIQRFRVLITSYTSTDMHNEKHLAYKQVSTNCILYIL